MRQMMLICAVACGVMSACAAPPPLSTEEKPGLYDGHLSGDFFASSGVNSDASVSKKESIYFLNGIATVSTTVRVVSADNRAMHLIDFADHALGDVPEGAYQYRLTAGELPEDDLRVYVCQLDPDNPDLTIQDAGVNHIDLNVSDTEAGKVFELHTEQQTGLGKQIEDSSFRFIPG